MEKKSKKKADQDVLRAGSITGYLIAEGFEDLAIKDLKNILWVHGQLILCKGKAQPCPWAQDLWYDIKVYEIPSIAEGTARLRAFPNHWALYGPKYFRRLSLIAGNRAISGKQLPVGFPPPPNAKQKNLGAITLLEPNLLVVSPRTDRVFPLGIPEFIESKSGPPSRAYLKLYEALSIAKIWPQPGDLCLEIGAAPGGWTWVLAQLGASVKTFDRAALDPRFAKHPLIEHHRKDAFSATPQSLEEAKAITWVFSDIICYPEKLYEWLGPWLAMEKPINFICTLKFQGPDHYGVIEKFAKLPNSRVVHLFHNKHELTWISSPASPYTA